jgi:hypothetical protein
VARPEGLVMTRQRWAVNLLGDRAEELERFEVIDPRGHRPAGLTWDPRSWVHRRVLVVEEVRDAAHDRSQQSRVA